VDGIYNESEVSATFDEGKKNVLVNYQSAKDININYSINFVKL